MQAIRIDDCEAHFCEIGRMDHSSLNMHVATQNNLIHKLFEVAQ
jgi:hypothetical protein